MTIEYTFKLNGEEFTKFNIGALSVKAFSGMDEYRNKKQYHCMLNKGPIPLGKY